MHGLLTIILLLACGTETGDAPDAAPPRVTAGLAEQIRAGTGRLTEADAVKLLPAAYRLEPWTRDADWRLTCAETTEIRVEFVAGKLTSRSARFDPTVTSQNLTPQRFRLLKDGMTVKEVETLLGTRNRKVVATGKDDQNRRSETWRWVQGRELWIFVTAGKVTGCGHIEYTEK